MLLRKGALTSWQIDRLKKGDPTGFFFGESKVLFHLAEGTFARVYRGEHTPTRGPVAIKVLRQRFAAISEAVERFRKEAEAGIRLHHPNIVKIIDVGQHDNRHFMIMEYVEGMNLRDFMRLRPRIKPEQALPLMLGMAEGLKYSLDRGVTHRDIKGTNILISNTGVAKLVDFGLATIQGDDSRPGVKSQRTVDYSALERACNSPKGDPRSDIYFLGCVYYQMVTGQLAMPETESKDMLAKMLKRSFGAIVPITEHRYAPDEEISRIIERMMKMDLKARYQSMDDVVADLGRFYASLRRPRPKPPVVSTPPTAQIDAMADLEAHVCPNQRNRASRQRPSQPWRLTPGRRSSSISRSRPSSPRACFASRRKPRSRMPCARTFPEWVTASCLSEMPSAPPSGIAKLRSTPSFSTRTAKVPNRSTHLSTCMKRQKKTVISWSRLSCSGRSNKRSGKNFPKATGSSS